MKFKHTLVNWLHRNDESWLKALCLRQWASARRCEHLYTFTSDWDARNRLWIQWLASGLLACRLVLLLLGLLLLGLLLLGLLLVVVKRLTLCC